MDIVALVEEFGFTTVMVVGLGYFVYYVWFTITKTIDPAVGEMKKTIIRLTDQLRLLDQDMIRLQQKVNTVLELKEENKLKDEKSNDASQLATAISSTLGDTTCRAAICSLNVLEYIGPGPGAMRPKYKDKLAVHPDTSQRRKTEESKRSKLH